MLALLTKIILILIGIGAFITIGLPFLVLGIFYLLGFILFAVHLLFGFVIAIIDIIMNPFRRL